MRNEEEKFLLGLRKKQGLGKAFWEKANGFGWRQDVDLRFEEESDWSDTDEE